MAEVTGDERARHYIDHRLMDQLRWYESKAAQAKRRHTWLAATQFSATAAVPVLNAFGSVDAGFVYVASCSAAFAAIAMGLLSLGRHQENWVRYRQAASALESIRWRYDHRAAPFIGEGREQMLVEQTEDVIGRESGQWSTDMSKELKRLPTPRPVKVPRHRDDDDD